MPTTHGGSRLKVSTSASRLILILPSVPKPTTWKTSLPMSTPIEAKNVVVMSRCCRVVFADYPSGGSSRSIPLAKSKASLDAGY
jgi:hypothetical protein